MKNIASVCALLSLIVLGSNLTGCKNEDTQPEQPEIAVTNSYLQCVVSDLSQGQTKILCLTPPGMCPGHFDISPSQVSQLANCRLFLRFDFQKSIDQALARMKDRGLKIGSVRDLPGLCVPETYLNICRDVCDFLSSEYPNRNAEYNQRLKFIEKRLDNLSKELLDQVKQAGLKSTKVLASGHQAEFCKWLGLDVIATFTSSDIETVSNINQCLQKARGKQIRFIIANKQEGTALANALAERLEATVVVFSNFPQINSHSDNFDQLLLENVRALLEAANPR